jgi:hypothetical protein
MEKTSIISKEQSGGEPARRRNRKRRKQKEIQKSPSLSQHHRNMEEDGCPGSPSNFSGFLLDSVWLHGMTIPEDWRELRIYSQRLRVLILNVMCDFGQII